MSFWDILMWVSREGETSYHRVHVLPVSLSELFSSFRKDKFCGNDDDDDDDDDDSVDVISLILPFWWNQYVLEKNTTRDVTSLRIKLLDRGLERSKLLKATNSPELGGKERWSSFQLKFLLTWYRSFLGELKISYIWICFLFPKRFSDLPLFSNCLRLLGSLRRWRFRP